MGGSVEPFVPDYTTMRGAGMNKPKQENNA